MTASFVWTEMCRGCREPYSEVHPFARAWMQFLLNERPYEYNRTRENNQLNMHSDLWTYYDWAPNPDSFLIGEMR